MHVDEEVREELLLRMPRLPRLCGMEGSDSREKGHLERGGEGGGGGGDHAMNEFFFDDELVGIFGLSSPSPIDDGKRIDTTTIKQTNALTATTTQNRTPEFDACIGAVTHDAGAVNDIGGDQRIMVPTPSLDHHMRYDDEQGHPHPLHVVPVSVPAQPMTNTAQAPAVGNGAIPLVQSAFGGAAPKIPTAAFTTAATAAEKEATTTGAKTDATVKRRRCVKSTSCFRGVTHHCRTGRWESHVWDNGKQIYLGGFDSEEQAALAYDLAIIRCRGASRYGDGEIDGKSDAGGDVKSKQQKQHAWPPLTNFHPSNYESELNALDEMTRDELVASLRRQSKGIVFSAASGVDGLIAGAGGGGATGSNPGTVAGGEPTAKSNGSVKKRRRSHSRFRGIQKHTKGSWESVIGSLVERKYTVLGVFNDEEAAARQYDVASVRTRGNDAVTNFPIAEYKDASKPEK